MGKIKIEGYICERCSHKWVARNKEVMVCPKCFHPDTIISGDFKKISDYKRNNLVFCLSGKHRKINKIFNHKWIGKLIEIKAGGCLPILLTPEHKVFRVHCMQMSRSKKRKFKRNFLKPEFIEVLNLRKRPSCENKNSCGDYLFIPKLKPILNKERISLKKFTTSHGLKVLRGKGKKDYFLLNKDSAWVLGLYVAEGFSTGDKGDIIFCLGKHEKKLINKLTKKLDKLRLNYRNKEYKTASGIIVSSRILARALREWAGKNAKTKKIPDFILLHNDKEIYKEFLKGYLEGDGNWGIVDGRARVNANTVSITLALQLQLLSIRLGDFFNITQTDFSKYGSIYDGRAIKGGRGFLLRTSAGPISKFLGLKSLPRHNKSYISIEKGVLVPVNSIREINYTGKVYNLETEEGNYLASNIAVKNCKSPYWNIPRKNKNKKKRGK